MAKVAIKNENITSFGGIYHFMDVFSKLGFEKLTESVWGRRGCSGKAFSHGSIFSSLFFTDNRLKNYDIILGKTPTDKGKNTCKKQVCNQQ